MMRVMMATERPLRETTTTTTTTTSKIAPGTLSCRKPPEIADVQRHPCRLRLQGEKEHTPDALHAHLAPTCYTIFKYLASNTCYFVSAMPCWNSME